MKLEQITSYEHDCSSNFPLELDAFQNHLQSCIHYLSTSAVTERDLSQSDRARIALANFMFDLEHRGRQLFHLTTTYKPYRDTVYNASAVDRFFKTFYVQNLLPFLLNTRNIHTVAKKRIQPVCLAFIDEHETKAVSHCAVAHDLVKEYASRLHHHAILAVHEETLERFHQLIGTNTLSSGSFSHKIMTSAVVPCEPMRLLYASKLYKKYPDFLSFPDKYNRDHRRI